MKYLLLLGTTLGFAAPIAAQAEEKRADQIIVTATRTEATLAEVGQSVSVITRAEIENSQSVQAVDVLARLPGVSVAPSGGFGQPTSLFVRGADNAQSLVLIDGVRINDPSDVGGGFDFGGLTISQFDRVELVRGSQSVLWGSRAMGGVINFITARPTEEWHGRASAEYGWRDRKQLSLSTSGKAGPLGLSAGGNWLKGDGYSTFNEARGGTERDGFESQSANLRAEMDLLVGLSVDAGGYYTKASYDYDNFGSDALHNGAKRDVTAYGNLRYAGMDDKLKARIGFGLTDSNRLSNHAIFGPYITNGRNERLEGQVEFSPADFVSLLVGGESEKSTFDDNYGSLDSTRIDSGFASLKVQPLSGLTINAGIRQDDHQDFGQHTSLSANASWALAGGDAPVLRASYGEGFKAPSLYQLYTNTGFAALKPETAKAFDVGVEQPFANGHGRFTLSWFDRRTRNLIDYDFGTGTYFNVGQTRAKGAELAMEISDWNGFEAGFNVSWLDATNQLTGKKLARRPRHSAFAHVDYRWSNGLSTGVDIRRGGSRFDDSGNFNLVAGHTIVSLRAAMPILDGVELYGRVENLFNAHYEVVRTYGTATRSAYAGVRAKF